MAVPIESLISDQESSCTSAGFVCGIDNLWAPQPCWREDEEIVSESPYLPQYNAALEILQRFFGPAQKVWIHLAAAMQAGKTGVLCTLIRLMLITHNFLKIRIPFENIFVVTGMNDNAWKTQTRKRLPIELRLNVHHNAGLARVQASLRLKAQRSGGLKNVLVVIDESHFAAQINNQPARQIFQTMRELCPVSQWAENNVRLLTISATDPGAILAVGAMRESAHVVRLLTSASYQSVESLKDAGRIHDTFDLNKEADVKQLTDFIETTYGADAKLYHVLRPRALKLNMVREALQTLVPGCIIINWDAKSNASRKETSTISSDETADINNILEEAPDAPTFILLKNMFYASKTLLDTHVGVLYDRKSMKDDTNLQSLLGRACGYGKSTRTHIFATMSTVTNWIQVWKNLCPRSGVLVPDTPAKSLHRRMVGLGAEDTAAGARLHIERSRALPLVHEGRVHDETSPFAPPAPSRHSNQNSDVQLREFNTMQELVAFWKTVAPGETTPRTPNRNSDGVYTCSLGGKSGRQSAEAVRRFCIGTRGWGSGITNADVGDFVKRVYVGYEEDESVKYFLRWTIKA